MERRVLRVFISSPADVRPERLIAERVVRRLAREFSYHFVIEPVLWEREPLVASEHFQERIIPPRETEIAVVILWSRLGVLLPEDTYKGALSGKPVTGTEWEFEDALASYRDKKLPDLLLYRKKVEVVGSLEDEAALRERLGQKRMVEDFMVKWTRSADNSSFTAAFWEFDTAAGFDELLETHVRELVRRKLTSANEGPAGIRWHQGSPFRGLESFDLEHSSVFFGRTRARNELRELLARQEARGCAFVLVIGASGSGKSSLVKAGLLADVKVPGMVGRVALCRHAILRAGDGDDPIATLATALLQSSALPELTSLEYTAKSLADLLRAGQAVLPIKQGLVAAGKEARLSQKAQARLFLCVDQLEELFTRDTIAAADREAFVAALAALAESGHAWVVATMRSDFFDRLETMPRLLELSTGEARYLVAPPEVGEISQMIRQPAREAGVRFEVDAAKGLALDEAIQQAATKDAGALPLLSFLLDQLWQRREPNGMLTFAAYTDLGGLEGSLGRRADEVFAALPTSVQAVLPEVLRALVTVGPVAGAQPPTARVAPMVRFRPGTAQRSLIDALLDPKARLLVAHSDGVRVAHEALLSHWEVARRQIETDARDLQLRARLEQSAELWQAGSAKHRTSLLVPKGLPLDEARDLVERWQGLDPVLVDYVAASRRAARTRTIKLVGLTAGAIALLPTVLAVVWLVRVWTGVRAVESDLAIVDVPAGCFMMGSPDDEPGREASESPLHRVCVPAFQIGELEITQDQWSAVMLGNPSQYVGEGRPVENVSYNDVQTFIARMNRFGHRHYRLPSEAEWEYADRAGASTAFPWGANADPDGCAYANFNDKAFAVTNPMDPITTSKQPASCDDGHDLTAPVGSFKPNAFGIRDMQGNVWEWVADGFHPSYAGAPGDGSVWPTDDPNITYVLRGGGWHTVGRRIRSAQRDHQPPDYHIGYSGFRVAISP